MVARKKTVAPKKENKSQKGGDTFLKMIFSKLRNPRVIFIILLLIVGLLLYFFKGLFVVALVNGQPITRLAYMKELEREAGKRVIQSLVSQKLILDEAKKQNVTVSEEETENEIKKIEESISKQGQNFDELLSLQGITRNELKERIKIQKLVEKMVEKEVTITDKEIDDYLKEDKETLPKDLKPEELREKAKENLKQEKVAEKMQTWFGTLQNNAKINYFIKI